METARHFSTAELAAGLDDVRRSPREVGVVRKIVRRPAKDRRESLAEGRLVVGGGLEGDCWNAKGTASLDIQLTLMNSRLAQLVAGSDERWELAGDQLYVDLDLSQENLPPERGSRSARKGRRSRSPLNHTPGAVSSAVALGPTRFVL